MTAYVLEDYLRAVRSQLKQLPYGEQDQVMREIKSHLEEEMGRLRKEDSALSKDEAALIATQRFGDPTEIGVAHGPQGGVVRKSTGEVVLRVAVLTGRAALVTTKAAGRGVRTLLKWTGIIALVLVGIAFVLLVIGVFAADQFVDRFENDIKESIPRPVYGYQDSWAIPNLHNDIRSDTFQINVEVKEFRVAARSDQQTGCVAIQLSSPSGQVIDLNGNGCEDTSKTTTYVEQGTWTIRYVFTGYTGSIDVQVIAFENAE